MSDVQTMIIVGWIIWHAAVTTTTRRSESNFWIGCAFAVWAAAAVKGFFL